MPVDYRIDKENSVVFTTASGKVTAEEILTGRSHMADDPGFSPNMKQLVDMVGVSEVAITTKDLRGVAACDPFGTGAKRALVGDRDVTFGMLRMYEVLSDRQDISVMVFRDIEEACEWLGIDPRAR
jgi:hypothetical protein